MYGQCYTACNCAEIITIIMCSILINLIVRQCSWIVNEMMNDMNIARDHFVYVPSQWETTLHCNVVSHWQSTFTKRSLIALNQVEHFHTKYAHHTMNLQFCSRSSKHVKVRPLGDESDNNKENKGLPILWPLSIVCLTLPGLKPE